MDHASIWVFPLANCPGRDAIKLPAAEKLYYVSSGLTRSADHCPSNDLLLHFSPKFISAKII